MEKQIIHGNPLRAEYLRLAAECVAQLARAPHQIAGAQGNWLGTRISVYAHTPQPYSGDMPGVDILLTGPRSTGPVEWVENGIRYRLDTVAD